MVQKNDPGETVVCKSEEYLVEEVDEELVLFDPDSGKTIQLNESGRLIWDLCNGERSVSEISELLKKAFPEAAEQIALEVNQMVRQFEEEGIVKRLS